MSGSLYSLLVSQHQEQLAPMRCTPQLVSRLVRHFEDLVVENRLNALVVQGRCLDGGREDEVQRFAGVSANSRHHYVFACGSNCPKRTWTIPTFPNSTLFEQRDFHDFDTGPFFLIVDAHVSILLASERVQVAEGEREAYNTVWSFEPDVVFSALEYLHARVAAQHGDHEETFVGNLRNSAPHSPSLRMTLNFTTKLALLLQRQTEIETAINQIASLVNSVFELEDLFQRIVELVGRCLDVQRAALAVWQRNSRIPESVHEAVKPQSDTVAPTGLLFMPTPAIEVPIVARGVPLGVLTVEDDTPGRSWEPEEEMMLRTVADHLAVGITNARLIKVIETQSVTDELTGLYNRRYFLERLEREVQFSQRSGQPVSLVIVALENQPSDDEPLALAVSTVKTTLRTVDILCRFSATVFAGILPATGRQGAIMAAERLRAALTHNNIDSDFGISSYPSPAMNSAELLSMAFEETRMSRA